MTTPAETAAWLRAVADEVERDPSRWTGGAFARTKSGNVIRPQEATACCWCALGFALRDNAPEFAITALFNAADCGPGVARMNDALETPAEFVAWFRRAAELAEQEGHDG